MAYMADQFLIQQEDRSVDNSEYDAMSRKNSTGLTFATIGTVTSRRTFPSNNALHRHVRDEKHGTSATQEKLPVIESNFA